MEYCENVDVDLWTKAIHNKNTSYPNLLVSIHMGSPRTLSMIDSPDHMEPEILGVPWESYDNEENVILDENNLAFQLTDPNMIVVTFTNPGDTWSVCTQRDEEDAFFLSQPYWINTTKNSDDSPNLLTDQARVYFPGDYLFNSLVVWENALESYSGEFNIFPLTYKKGLISKEPWSGFHRKEAHEYSDHGGKYKSMTFKYLLDEISRYHKGRFGRFAQPPYIVYISACNPYPERDLGWNSGQMQEIVHNQNLYDELGLNNTRCLKEKQLRTSTRFETRDADSSNLGTESDIDRWERHYEGIYDSEYAENESWRAQNFGITLKDEVCESECEPYFKCLPSSLQCLDYCKVKGKFKKCKKISHEEYDNLFGLHHHEKWEGGNKKKRRSKTRRRKRKLRKNKRNMTRQRKKSVIKKKRTRRSKN